MKFLLTLFLFAAPVSSYAESFADHSAALSSSFDFEAQKKYKEAIEVLIKAQKKAPDSYILNYRLGYLYAVAGPLGQCFRALQCGAEERTVLDRSSGGAFERLCREGQLDRCRSGHR